MNELVVPPAPHWYKSSVVACSPDNTLVYGAKNDIVIIEEKTPNDPASINFIYGAHLRHIVSVSLNRKWKDPHSYVVSLGEDNITKVWNLETLEKKTSNKDLVESKSTPIGAIFAGDDRVVSAASNGCIVVWNINTNESKTLNDLFKSKVTLTCLSSCPHAGWLIAFGLSNGAVIVADLRRNGKVLYRLRGHYQAVVSLSWCPAPVNIFPQHPNNTVKNKSPEETKTEDCIKSDKEKVNPWVNLVHADDNEVPLEKQQNLATQVDDFLQECDNLKSKILGLESSVAKDDTTAENDAIEEKQPEEDKRSKNEKNEEISQKSDNGRPLPTVFDFCGDILDDLYLGAVNEGSKKIEDDQNREDKNTSETNESEATKEEKVNGDGDKINSPSNTEPVEEEPRTEYLLASSSKDRSVYIWRAGSDGRMQTFFYASRKGNRRDKNVNIWISLCWITPDTLLTSSATGDILLWPLPKPKESNKQYKLVHHEHSSLVFNIVAPPRYVTPLNWRDKGHLSIWTWSQDGKLVNYDVTAEKVNFSYLTVTSGVTCFDSSSYLDPNRLAIGLRDGSLHVWDLSLPHTRTVTMQKHQQKFTQKVSTIAWHPLKEMTLGFGTEEGRVGFIDLLSKKTTMFPHYFRNQVYKVEWGPLQGDTSILGLYVVAEGKIAIHDTKKPDEDPIQVELPSKLIVHQIAWKPDFGLLLLNGRDGALVILKTDLVAITTIYPTDKGLNMIVWHPDAFTNKTTVSTRCNWFAATTPKGVLVFDCASIDKSDSIADKIVALFEGHVRPPLALAWCPFEGNRIVSTAPDGLAHVWDVTTKSIVATFVDPCLSSGHAVIWSPVNPDLIITGDRIIRIWSVSQNPPKADEKFLATRKRQIAKAIKNEVEKTEKIKIKVDIPKSKITLKNSIVPGIRVHNDENASSQIEDMRKVMNGDQSSNLKIDDPLQMFGTKDQVTQLLDANYHLKEQENKYKSCELISLWKGNVGEYIQKAIDENRVTPSIIALAPMASPKLWQDACLQYARKLSEEADCDPIEAATYFLACHKVEEAINCLTTNGMFKEALVLAKQRLPQSSEIITQVTIKWAEHCVTTGNFENAAFCYISLKQYESAAKVLARRSHKEYLEFALELAEKDGNKGLYDSIKFKCAELENQPNESSDLSLKIDVVLKSTVEDKEKTEISVLEESQNGIPNEEESLTDQRHTLEHCSTVGENPDEEHGTKEPVSVDAAVE